MMASSISAYAPGTTPAKTTTSNCGCGASPCGNGSSTALERTRFFARQLVGPTDLTQDQLYFREKLKRHNRMLHGWGVVCGACVGRGKAACDVVVYAGYVLGPYGDEIVIPSDITVDLCKLGVGEQIGCCDGDLDPWCGDTQQRCAEGTVYLAVRYEECLTKPVRAVTGNCGCGCDDAACEYSRIRDGYAFKVLRELPDTYATPFVQPPLTVLEPCRTPTPRGRSCPQCPDNPWVILADISITADCTVRAVDCFAHRRYVVSLADFFFVCEAGQAAPGKFAGMIDHLQHP
jgi:hypothetical protein